MPQGEHSAILSTFIKLKYCRMPQGEHSAILSTLLKLPFDIKAFVFKLSIFERPLKTGFTVDVEMQINLYVLY